jgi:hypothetical protein
MLWCRDVLVSVVAYFLVRKYYLTTNEIASRRNNGRIPSSFHAQSVLLQSFVHEMDSVKECLMMRRNGSVALSVIGEATKEYNLTT